MRNNIIDLGPQINKIIPEDTPVFVIDSSSEKTLNGSSEYTDDRSIKDKISVVVEDVHPNGNLVVIGTRERDIAGDSQTVQVSGIVRPRDIAFDNTIYSKKVANFKMVTINKGYSQNYNDSGWLTKIFDFFWPL